MPRFVPDWFSCALGAVVLVSCCTCSTIASPQRNPAGSPAVVTNGVIDVMPGAFALGDIEPGSEHARTFILMNKSNRPVKVQRSVTSCKCTTTSDIDGALIAVGGSLEFEAVLTAPRTPGIKTAKVQIFFDDGSRPISMELEGDVTMAIKATPAYVGGPRGKVESGVVQVESIDGRSFSILSAGNEPPRYAGFNPENDEPRSRYTLRWDLARIQDLPRHIWWVVYTDHSDCPVLPLRIRNDETGSKADQVRFQRNWIFDENVVNAEQLTSGVPVDLDVVIKHYNPRRRGQVEQPTWRVVQGVTSLSQDASVELVSSEAISDEEVRVVFRLTPRPGFTGPLYALLALETATGMGEFSVLALVKTKGG